MSHFKAGAARVPEYIFDIIRILPSSCTFDGGIMGLNQNQREENTVEATPHTIEAK